MGSDLFNENGAVLSPCGTYRYRLWRQWRTSGAPVLGFVMLNPSTADAEKDDATIRKCCSIARALGYGGISVTNLFALRSTDPAALYTHPDPVGPDNWRHLLESAKGCEQTICAWGNHGAHRGQGRAVRRYLADSGIALYALRLNQNGEPAHPLYLPLASPLIPWSEWPAALTQSAPPRGEGEPQP